jgi:hypothetical protein
MLSDPLHTLALRPPPSLIRLGRSRIWKVAVSVSHGVKGLFLSSSTRLGTNSLYCLSYQAHMIFARCGHCKRLAPTWSQLARYMQHKLAVADVNCDENTQLCQSFDVQGYPTLIYFSGGSKTEYTGGRSIEQLKSFAEKVIAPYVFGHKRVLSVTHNLFLQSRSTPSR